MAGLATPIPAPKWIQRVYAAMELEDLEAKELVDSVGYVELVAVTGFEPVTLRI